MKFSMSDNLERFRHTVNNTAVEESQQDVRADGSSCDDSDPGCENNLNVGGQKCWLWHHAGEMPQEYLPAPKLYNQVDCHSAVANAHFQFKPPLSSDSSSSLELHVKPRIRRRKFGEGDKHSLGGRPLNVAGVVHLAPIVVTPEVLRIYFNKPLHEAARCLGICATAVKKICRKMGIKEWPYQRIKPIRRRLAKLHSCIMTPDAIREIRELQDQELALLDGSDLACFCDM
jgi:hypothetical protein